MRNDARVGITGLFLVLATTWNVMPVSADPHDPDESGQVTVMPGDPYSGEIEPPRVHLDAEYGKHSTGVGDVVTGGPSSGAARVGNGSGSGSGPTCRVERASGAGFAQVSSSPEEMRQYFPDLFMGSRGGDESEVFIMRCSDGSTGWIVGDGAGSGTGGTSAVALPSPVELAERARRQLVLPLPSPGMSPKVELADGRDATLVNENTWVWTDPGVWEERTERVQVGPVWAEVTARPTSMRFTSGMGQSVTCAGPGTPYDRSYGMHAASPDCGLRFTRSSESMPDGETTAEYAIRWSVSWRGSTGASGEGGELPDMISRASESFVVAEAQSLRSS
ncbi:hypothetical protein [Haloechinothrix halophila]|uniref:hypothetical protein n=1 Tax=Haloechinothrix halophila TaxID=1069073 RepID=UPI001E635F49|nr:hypothetical protein [Haloechinothrix halophila]